MAKEEEILLSALSLERAASLKRAKEEYRGKRKAFWICFGLSAFCLLLLLSAIPLLAYLPKLRPYQAQIYLIILCSFFLAALLAFFQGREMRKAKKEVGELEKLSSLYQEINAENGADASKAVPPFKEE